MKKTLFLLLGIARYAACIVQRPRNGERGEFNAVCRAANRHGSLSLFPLRTRCNALWKWRSPALLANGSLGNKSGWEATGYDYRDKSIEGFPCLHEFQVGGVVLMPTTGKLVTVPGCHRYITENGLPLGIQPRRRGGYGGLLLRYVERLRHKGRSYSYRNVWLSSVMCSPKVARAISFST